MSTIQGNIDISGFDSESTKELCDRLSKCCPDCPPVVITVKHDSCSYNKQIEVSDIGSCPLCNINMIKIKLVCSNCGRVIEIDMAGEWELRQGWEDVK